ncbi:MAG: hypothetical protein R3B72_35920 [Polyangiaceae bacterium]
MLLRASVAASSALLLSFVGAACGDDGAASGSGGASSSSAGGETSSSTGAGGGVDQGSPHTPATGCLEGFVECDGICADQSNDGSHCGECGNACFNQSAGLGCVGGECVESSCTYGAVCGDACVTNRSSNADHCGSCFNQCASDGLCAGGTCVDGGGDGSSCASPLFWNVDDDESVGFRFTPALTTEHLFTCGPLDPLPTRWFRFTANDTETGVEVRADGADDFIIEAFDAATCAPVASIGCNDDDAGANPQLTLATAAGGTYFVAVGLKGSWSGRSATFRADH